MTVRGLPTIVHRGSQPKEVLASKDRRRLALELDCRTGSEESRRAHKVSDTASHRAARDDGDLVDRASKTVWAFIFLR